MKRVSRRVEIGVVRRRGLIALHIVVMRQIVGGNFRSRLGKYLRDSEHETNSHRWRNYQSSAFHSEQLPAPMHTAEREIRAWSISM